MFLDPNILNAERRLIKALRELDYARTYVGNNNHKRCVTKLDACLRELNRAKQQVRAAVSNAYERGTR